MIARLLVTTLFLFLGGLAFLAQRALLQSPSESASEGATRRNAEAALLWEAERRGLHRRDAIVRDRLVRNMRFTDPASDASDQELFERALALGMHRSDPIARAELCHRTAERLAAVAAPADSSRETLRRYLHAHAGRYRRDGVVAFRQLLVARPEDSPPSRQGVERLLDGLRSGQVDPSDAGEATLLPARMQAIPARIASRFGEDFARALDALEPGAWRGPVESRFGTHLVWVESRGAERLPALDEVAEAVRIESRHDARKARRREAIRDLQERYAAARGGTTP